MNYETIYLFGLPNCVQCRATERDLEKYGIPYHYFDLTHEEHASLRDELKKEGFLQAPVVEVEDFRGNRKAIWTGYQPDKIKDLRN